LGSDTGGSIRQPASFCGVVGLKPTYGAVSRYGLIAMASSLDQIGPITKTVLDAEILYEAIAGYDELDSTSVKGTVPDQKFKNIQGLSQKLQKLKVGVPKEYFIKGIDKEVEVVVKKAIEKLEKSGAKIIEVSLPHTPFALAVYYLIMPSEVSSNLARYDGIKYGYSKISNLKSQISNLMDVYLKSRAEGFGDEPKRRIMLGTFALSSGYYEAYYLKAKKVQAKIKEDFDKAFQKVDCLVTPTSPTVAFEIGEKTEDPLTMYLSDIFTVPINLAGLPAISLPCGFVDGLPVGLQIIGKQFGEQIILNLANAYEQSTNWYKIKPKI
jgi:aspartyl-tRNA(Asn)/glutamyl-tRNA(Gln) amidotransferase subunit A